MTHLTREEREARGAAARVLLPRGGARRRRARGTPGPTRSSCWCPRARPGVPELRPAPVRAHGDVAVRVLPRCRADHGVRPRGRPRLRARRPALRRRAHVELRRVRHARAAAAVRPQRLRRDAARAVRVGREASGGERRGRGAEHRARRPRRAGRSSRTSPGRTATAMRDFADKANLEVWYARVDVDDFLREHRDDLGKAQAKRTQSTVTKARTRDHLQSVGKLTEVVDGRRRFRLRPAAGHDARASCSATRARASFTEAMGELVRAYQAQPAAGPPAPARASTGVVDMARKVVGVGSVGTRAWILLLQGVDEDDLLILQAKEAQASVLEQFLGRQRVHPVRPAGGRGAAADAGRERRDARLAAEHGHRRCRARLLRPPAARLEGLGGHRGDAAGRLPPVRRAVRLDAGPRARPVR